MEYQSLHLIYCAVIPNIALLLREPDGAAKLAETFRTNELMTPLVFQPITGHFLAFNADFLENSRSLRDLATRIRREKKF